MNSLEYIEKQILFVKQNIQYHKDLLTTTEDGESIEIIKSTIKLLEPDLQALQRIKTELEAWEVAKKVLNHFDIKLIEGILIGLCDSSEINKDEVQNFKKTLEVENER